jgi:hypothetical protein
MNLNTVNPYTAAAEKAIAAQRAANGRKKLVKSADDTAHPATSEETLFLSTWMNAKQGQRPVQRRASGKDPDFG